MHNFMKKSPGQRKTEQLFYAIEMRSPEIILPRVFRFLEESAAEGEDICAIINGENRKGRTPLLEYLAQGDKDRDIIMKLLSLGADPTLRPDNEHGALFYLCSAPCPGDFAEIFGEFFALGVDPNEPVAPSLDSDSMDITRGASPLAWLAYNEKLTPELVHVFADGGADVNSRDRNGDTILSLGLMLRSSLSSWPLPGSEARKKSFWEIKELAKALFERGANLQDKKDEKTSFLLSWPAFIMGDAGTARYLAVLIAAGGGEQVRKLFEYAVSDSAFWVKRGESRSKADNSLLALIALGFIYPESNEMLHEIWRGAPQGRGLNILLEGLADAETEDMKMFAPLFVNIMSVIGEGKGTLKVKSEVRDTLISLLLAAMDLSPETAVEFISRKLKKQMGEWEEAAKMGELAIRLGEFIREKEQRKEHVREDKAYLNLAF